MPEIFDASTSRPQTDSNDLSTETGDSTSSTSASSSDTRDQRKTTLRQSRKTPHMMSEEERAKLGDRSHRHVDDYSEVMRHERASANPIRAFLPKPLHMRFSTQGSSENIVLLLRQHPVTQIKWVFMAIGAAVAPILFSGVDILNFLPSNYQFAAYLGWYLMLTGFILESFLKWFFNVYILTDERIVDVDFVSLIYKNISAAKIDNIEDVTAVQGGFLASLFDFGTVTVQTAAEKREFEFAGIPQPNKVTTIINDLILEEEKEKIEGRVQ